MKKFLLIGILVIGALIYSGCSKNNCDWCNEEKYCEETRLGGEKLYICSDCKSSIQN